MKLSEAIRKGIKMDGSQCFNSFFQIKNGEVVSCCALGAAALGAGFNPITDCCSYDVETATELFLQKHSE